MDFKDVLPMGTQLGNVKLLEIYDEFIGPKCFSVIDESKNIHLVYWEGSYDDGREMRWVYMPVTAQELGELTRNGEDAPSFYEAYKRCDELKLVKTYASPCLPASCDVMSAEAKSEANLPPESFLLDESELEAFEFHLARNQDGQYGVFARA
jgi:hypothetical protein